ncbi:hypothetical protein DSM3645_02753 [Blastopirellula marina DSM 3645]|uniref:Uncharacterized protein n=1 Tax=Blastopirellula marina DSM 3645 TaxID=314230 RepID=A3ZVL4_9BACT|nr:hypothetical protein DSM3645_02753 [Blastopirellula marina DSM 3645]
MIAATPSSRTSAAMDSAALKSRTTILRAFRPAA